MFCMLKKEKIHPVYVAKHNWNLKKQVILLMHPNGKGHELSKILQSETLAMRTMRAKSKWRWHYLAVKKLSAVLRWTRSKHNCDFYCLNCLHSFRTKSKPESHKGVC